MMMRHAVVRAHVRHSINAENARLARSLRRDREGSARMSTPSSRVSRYRVRPQPHERLGLAGPAKIAARPRRSDHATTSRW